MIVISTPLFTLPSALFQLLISANDLKLSQSIPFLFTKVRLSSMHQRWRRAKTMTKQATQKNFQRIDINELERLVRSKAQSEHEESSRAKNMFSFLKPMFRIRILISAV